MAAAVGVENILKNPVDSISTNYHGSEVVLNAANKFDKRIIIASTSEIYGKITLNRYQRIMIELLECLKN